MHIPRGLSIVVLALLALATLAGCSDDEGSGDAADDTADGAAPSGDGAGDDGAGDDGAGDDGAGDDGAGDDGSAGPLTDALTDEIRSSFTDQGVGDALPEDEAECAARSIVDQVGEERLAELGVTPENAAGIEAVIRDAANVSEREAIATALSDCVDLVRTLSAVYGAIGLSETSANCVAEGIVADADLRTTLLLGDEPAGDTVTRFDELAASCFTPEEQEMFGPDAGSVPPGTGP